MAEGMLGNREIFVTNKTMHTWAEKFARAYAYTIRDRTLRLGGRWHLDEMIITIKDERHFLSCTVDQDGFVLDGAGPETLQYQAAKRFMRKLFSAHGCAPWAIITHKLCSYGADKREVGLILCDHRQHKGLNNRAKSSHWLIRRRERIMKRFRSARNVRRFTSIHDPIYNLHYFPRNQFNAADHRALRQTAINIWRKIARLKSV